MVIVNGFKKSLFKVFKYTLSVLGVLIVLLSVTIGVVLNFVFTPEKLTKIVMEQTQDFIDGDITCEEIDLTVFSTFPNVGLQLKSGALIPSKSLLEEIKPETDTLLNFDKIEIRINPVSLLKDNVINIRKVILSGVDIYAYINKDGKSNWDILKIEQEEKTDSIEADSSSFESKIEIGVIEISDANLTFDDRSTEIFADLRGFDTSLKGNFSKDISNVDLSLSAKNLLFWQEGKLLVNKLAFSTDMIMDVDLRNHDLNIDKSVFEVNGMRIGFAGNLNGDSINNTLDVDIEFGMEIPSLKTVVDMIPVSMIEEAAKAKAEGYVALKGSLKGIYGKDKLPSCFVQAFINDGKLSYEGMPYSVDKLELKAEGLIDFEEKKNSYFSVEKFIFQGASSDLKASFVASDLLNNPVIESDINAKINFTELASTFPLKDGVTFAGEINSAINAKFKLNDLKNQDYGKLNINGYLNTTDVKLDAPTDSFLFEVDKAGLQFGANNKVKNENYNRELLNAIIGFRKLNVSSKMGSVKADSTSISFKTSPLLDTTAVTTMSGNFNLGSLNVVLKDSTYLNSGKINVEAEILPSTNDKKKPVIKSKTYFETLYAGTSKDIVYLKNAGFNLSSHQSANNKKYWKSNGVVGFETIKLYSAQFPLLISLPASKLSLSEDEIILHHTGVKVGSSDVKMSGKLSNLYETFFNQGTLYGNLNVSSDFIDCNEIIKAMESGSKDEEINIDVLDKNEMAVNDTDSVASFGVFIVPDKIDFTLSTDVKHVKFNKLNITNISGDLIVRNQAVELDKLSMHTLAADMTTSMVYKASDAENAFTGFELDMKDIRVGMLVEIMPALDTLVPMLRSLDGLVNCRIAAKAEFDKNMDIKIPSLQAATRVKGDSLVLMDGETFSEISKMLRFKNKDKNIVDSVSVDMVINDGMIEIFPFLIGMDRYLAAVAGKHNMDMTFKYHVSLLESPLPFKAGVDVYGNMDDFKFRITKAKLKNIQKSAVMSPVDSTSLQVNNYIKNILNKKVHH